jgi:hypothetical protein
MFKLICNLSVIATILMSLSLATAAPHQFPEADLSKLGDIPRINTPLYIMEYHIWYKSPFGLEAPDGYVHWDMTSDLIDHPIGPDWMRDKAPVDYPMMGLYNSEDPNIIRWQLQCMKNAGADATFVQMFPDWVNGKTFDRTFVWDNIINLADELGYKVGMHDEVAFRTDRPAQQWDVMGQRIGEFIKQYGNRPGFLKINNQPAVAFQFWNRFRGKMSPEDLEKMIDLAEKTAGMDIYWILHIAPNDSIYKLDKVDAFIPMASTNALLHRVPGYTENPNLDWAAMDEQINGITTFAKKYPKRDIGFWAYAGFNESPRVQKDNRTQFRWMKRDQGRTLMKTLARYEQENPKFMVVTSWNDWQENTAIEPGWQSDTLDGDPYFYCKLLAQMKGTTFTAPLFPVKESVDPWMWQTLYGIDKTPPVMTHVRYKPMAPAIMATAMDTGSAITSVKVADHGDCYVDASDYNKPQFVGVTSIEPGRTVEGGYPLSTTAPITLQLDTSLISQAKASKFYVALEYADTTDGAILVYYPNAHKIINYKPGDENRFDVCAGIKLGNTGMQAAAVRPMLGFLKDAKTITLQIQLKGSRANPKPSPITVSRVHVFADMNDAKEGYRMDAGKPDSQVQTVMVYVDNLKTMPTQKAAYIIAEDAAGNRSMPVAYHGVQSHPFMNQR